MSYFYSVYGMVVRSELELPELQPYSESAAPDLTIEIGVIDYPLPEQSADGRYRRITPTIVQSYWPGIGHFIAINGEKIVVSAPEAAANTLRLFLLGPLLGAILHQRGFLVLHASCVAIEGRVVGFLGASGWGKSTMAGALVGRGYKLIADDVTPVRFTTAGPVVYPGFPQLKLWPDAADTLGHDIARLPRLHPDEEKRAHRLAQTTDALPLPLGGLYVLAVNDEQQIEELSFQEAFVELVRHSYSISLLEGTGTSKEHFQQCSKLTGSVRVCRLSRPMVLSALTEVADMVERDARSTLTPE